MTPTVSPTQGNPASRRAAALGWRQDARGMWRHTGYALLAYRSGSGWRTGPTKRGADALDVRADSLGALVDVVAKLKSANAEPSLIELIRADMLDPDVTVLGGEA